MMKVGIFFLGSLLVMSMIQIPQAQSETVTVKRKCINGICGKAVWDGFRVNIRLSHKLSRATHYNFKTNPGDQIEINGRYSFEQDAGNSGTYSAQACDRGGIGARSTCTKWATFEWSTGAQEEEEEQ